MTLDVGLMLHIVYRKSVFFLCTIDVVYLSDYFVMVIFRVAEQTVPR